jgi:hypothetical protein
MGIVQWRAALTKVFAVIHLLFAVAFIWVGRMNMSANKEKE